MALTADQVYAILKRYVADTAIGLGALKGAPCTIKKIEYVDYEAIVTFEWTGTNGKKQTSEMKVPSGSGSGGDCKYTNPSTGRSVGGVPQNYEFKDTPISDVFDKLFEPAYKAPTATIALSIQNNQRLFAVQEESSWPALPLTVTAGVQVGTNPVTQVKLLVDGKVVETKQVSMTSNGNVAFSYGTSGKLSKNTTFRVEASDGTQSNGSQTVVTFIGYSYIGFVDKDEYIDDVTVDKLLATGSYTSNKSGKILKNSKEFTVTFESYPDPNLPYHQVYMYPSSLKDLTSIVDGSGFNNNAIYNENTSDSAPIPYKRTFDGIEYNVYITTAPNGSQGLVQKYS